MDDTELAAFERYYEEMWKMHCQSCATCGFMTQTREQFRANMLGFWKLNKKAQEEESNASRR